jgi:hypothetical protein
MKKLLKLISIWLSKTISELWPKPKSPSSQIITSALSLNLINLIIKVQEGNFMMVGRVLSVDESSDGVSVRGKANFISNQSKTGLREDGYNDYNHNDTWCYLSTGRDIVVPSEKEINHFLRCEERSSFVEPVFKFNKQFKHRML